MQVKAEPVKVKFASASNSVVVPPIVTSSLAVALFTAVIGLLTIAEPPIVIASAYKVPSTYTSLN